jgi:NADH:ubiquinone oxidoreductase subunit H
MFFIIEQMLLFLCIVVSVLVGVAYFTLLERKVIGAMQRRAGPNTIGFWGFFQPLADGLKLVVKQIIIPNKSNRVLFLVAPIYTLSLAFSN